MTLCPECGCDLEALDGYSDWIHARADKTELNSWCLERGDKFIRNSNAISVINSTNSNSLHSKT